MSGPVPANLLHMDVKKFSKFTEPGHAVTGDRAKRSRRIGWEYAHSIVDNCSRLAYSELHDDERADTVTAFTRRALDFFAAHGVVAERLMTDNAFAYTKNRSLRELLDRRAISHLRTRGVKEAVPPAPDRPEGWAGFIGRVVTVRVESVLWRRPKAPKPPNTFRFSDWGWFGSLKKRVAARVCGVTRMLGRPYLAPVAHLRGRTWYPFDEVRLRLDGGRRGRRRAEHSPTTRWRAGRWPGPCEPWRARCPTEPSFATPSGIRRAAGRPSTGIATGSGVSGPECSCRFEAGDLGGTLGALPSPAQAGRDVPGTAGPAALERLPRPAARVVGRAESPRRPSRWPPSRPPGEACLPTAGPARAWPTWRVRFDGQGPARVPTYRGSESTQFTCTEPPRLR